MVDLFFVLIYFILIAGPLNTLLDELDQSTLGSIPTRRARLVRAVGVLMQVAGGN